jgi:hypothetical protein
VRLHYASCLFNAGVYSEISQGAVPCVRSHHVNLNPRSRWKPAAYLCCVCAEAANTPDPDAVSGAPKAASTYVVIEVLLIGAGCWHGSNNRGALRYEALLAIRASLTSKMKNPAEAGRIR